MSIFSDLKKLGDAMLETRSTESKVHLGKLDRNGKYQDIQTGPMSDDRAKELAERWTILTERKIRRGEMRESERPEIWIEKTKKKF